MTITCRLAVMLVLVAATGAAAQAPRGRTVGADRALTTLTLVSSDRDRAVVRFGTGALELVSVGDRLGSSSARVREVAPGRLVLEEQGRLADGRPRRTLIVLKEGQTGGMRYTAELDEKAPVSLRPVVIGTKPSKPGKR